MSASNQTHKLSRSAQLPFNVASAARQSLLIGSGFSREDLCKPMVGIIVQQAQKIHPGQSHLSDLAVSVAQGVSEAGGLPVEINIGGFCDGVIMPNPVYTFAHRNLLVNMIEVAAEANLMDALVLLASCDKNVPAAVMGAARTNLPSILVLGGVMAPGSHDGKKINLENVIHSVGKVTAGEMSQEEFDALVDHACPGGGACSCMTTGTTMQIVTEALGMCLPGNASFLGTGEEIRSTAREAGQRVMKMWESEIRPRDIITEQSVSNAVKVCLAVGGSIHAMYHVPAIAAEAGLKTDVWRLFDESSQVIPTLVGIDPNGDHNMEDFGRAGGTPAIMKALSDHLNGDALTVSGKPVKSYYEKVKVKDTSVIHTFDDPWKKESGLAVMKGNLAEGGSVLRVSGVLPSMMRFRGRAKVFSSEAETIEYIRTSGIEEPTVLVVKNQGLIGAPGIRTLLPLAGEIVGRNIEEKVAIVTDGRFSGGARGLCIGLATPEAAQGGGLSLVQDGDFIAIDIPDRSVALEISETEMERRKNDRVPFEPDQNSPFLDTFIKSVRPLREGAVEGTLDRGKYRVLSE